MGGGAVEAVEVDVLGGDAVIRAEAVLVGGVLPVEPGFLVVGPFFGNAGLGGEGAAALSFGDPGRGGDNGAAKGKQGKPGKKGRVKTTFHKKKRLW